MNKDSEQAIKKRNMHN